MREASEVRGKKYFFLIKLPRKPNVTVNKEPDIILLGHLLEISPN